MNATRHRPRSFLRLTVEQKFDRYGRLRFDSAKAMQTSPPEKPKSPPKTVSFYTDKSGHVFLM
jgi:hypothetical protein